MKPRSRSTYGWIAGCSLIFVITVVGCSEDLTDPDPPQFARPANVDEVEVTATEPDSAYQDTTLYVDVLGDGFDDSSTVEFLLDSTTVAPKLRVKNVRYVNKKKLTVELEVDSTADIRLYDVRVTAGRGPKGIGTELFRVMERVKNNEGVFTVDSFFVTDVNPSVSTLCTAGEICNELTLLYSGGLDSIAFMVRPILSELYDDEGVEGNWRALGDLRHFATDFLIPQTPGRVTAHWQGQWRPLFWASSADTTYYGPMETMPDLAPMGAPTRYSFSYILGDAQGSPSFIASPFAQFGPQSEAHYRGWSPSQFMYVVADDFSVVTTGTKRWVRRYLELEIQTFSDPLVHTGETSVWAHTVVLHTDPDGYRSILLMKSEGAGHPTEPEIYKTVFRTDTLYVSGCHTFRVIGAEGIVGASEYSTANPSGRDHSGDRLYVWDPLWDPAGAAPFDLYFDSENTTVREGCGG